MCAAGSLRTYPLSFLLPKLGTKPFQSACPIPLCKTFVQHGHAVAQAESKRLQIRQPPVAPQDCLVTVVTVTAQAGLELHGPNPPTYRWLRHPCSLARAVALSAEQTQIAAACVLRGVVSGL